MGIKQEIDHAKTLFNHTVDLLVLRLQVLSLDLEEQAESTFRILAMVLVSAVLLLVGLLCILLGLNRLLGDTAAIWLFFLTGVFCLLGIAALFRAILAVWHRQRGRVSATLHDLQNDIACLRGQAAQADTQTASGQKHT